MPAMSGFSWKMAWVSSKQKVDFVIFHLYASDPFHPSSMPGLTLLLLSEITEYPFFERSTIVWEPIYPQPAGNQDFSWHKENEKGKHI